MRTDQGNGATTALDVLFGSGTRSALLAALLLHPEREQHLRDLVRTTGFSPRAVSKEIDRLVRAELLSERRSGNRRYLRANVDHPLHRPLREVVERSVGAIPILREALAADPRIRLAVLFGSAATGNERAASDVDVLIVGTIGLGDVLEVLAPAQTRLERDVRPVVMTPEEYSRRVHDREHFLTSILAAPIVTLVGAVDDVG